MQELTIPQQVINRRLANKFTFFELPLFLWLSEQLFRENHEGFFQLEFDIHKTVSAYVTG